jgi:hypothetical protein
MDKSKYRQRLIDPKVDFYLSTFGAVCIEGPKWCGKTWTSTMHAKSAFGRFWRVGRQLVRIANEWYNAQYEILYVNVRHQTHSYSTF